MENLEYDVIIVGSGAGGATLARELARKGKRILVIDRGKPQEKIGTFFDSLKYFNLKFYKFPPATKEGAILWQALMAGGTTVVSCGNAVRCLEKELAEFDINLDAEFSETEADMCIQSYEERRLSSGSKSILDASRQLGYHMEPMPKFIDPGKCRRCGNCQLGCKYGAKWTSGEYLNEAIKNGVNVRYGTGVEKVIIENGKAIGVQLSGGGDDLKITADKVVLAAGGVASPVILQKSGIEAGSGFFMDLLVNTYGVCRDLTQTNEPTMALVDLEFYDSKGFILSPFINQHRIVRYLEMGIKGMSLPTDRILGIMTKIRDEANGTVFSNRRFSKPMTSADKAKLQQGAKVSTEILTKAGVDPESIIVSKPQGGHPGGSAAIGRVVNKDLQTEVDNLFVCDASVLPASPGLPPILTIVALAKRLSKTLS